MLKLLVRARPFAVMAGVPLGLFVVADQAARRGILDHSLVEKALGAFLCVCVGSLLTVGVLMWLLRESRFSEERPEPVKKDGPDVNRLYYMREFLPETPPPGWSIPVAPRKVSKWVIDTGEERVLVGIDQESGLCALRVTAVRHDRAEIPDGRGQEILGHFRGVGEFVEGVGLTDVPAARTWVAVPLGLRPKWRVPKAPPEPREPELSPHLIAARKYLPERVPKGWSVPIAITDDHGMEWKDGAWMMGAGQEVIIACLCTSRGRVKLAVTIFRRDGEEVGEATALELLRQFRGVLEFVQTDPSEDQEEGPPRCTYLGELQPARGERAMLN